MTYKHGVYGSEESTSLVPMTSISAGLPVVFGTAPLHLATDSAGANKPVLCYTYAEAVAALGYSEDWGKYTLCEFMKSQYSLFNMAPVVFVNVLDTAIHKVSVAETDMVLTDCVIKIAEPVLLNTLVVKLSEASQPLVKGKDYTAAYDDDEVLIITALESGAAASATTLAISYDKLDASLVDADDVIGGIDITTGTKKGLELIDDVYPRFSLVPGQIVAPGWSQIPGVAAVMKAKETGINSLFEAISICDVPTDTVKKYSDVAAWKNNNNYVDERQILCWPLVSLSGKQYHMSTQLAGVICATDAGNDDIPYKSPSNESMQCDSAVLADGTEIYLDVATGAYLNGNGIVTAINFIGGWKTWGNRTTAYPADTDPKDSFIPVRRMFNWVNNTLITSFWQKIDDPMNKRLIENIVNSANIWLNGLTARQYLLGGRVEFLSDENSNTDLMDGILRFHVYFTPPSPAREIDFIQEYDTDYLATLFD